jgi:putative ATPase
MDLFSQARAEQISREAPLAARMRPRTLDEYVGQEHVIGPGRLLRRAIQADQLSSLIFYGPAGTGKTTLAMVIANTTRSRFVTLNAVLAGVKELREVVAQAQEDRNLYGQRTILFVDEVHRWNKAQQDALLPWVENGTIIMIGATTENPWFSVNRPLLSRSRVFLGAVTDGDLRRIAGSSGRPERGLRGRAVRREHEALEPLGA